MGRPKKNEENQKIINDDEKYCPACQKVKNKIDFYISYSPLHQDGKTPYCKSCIKNQSHDKNGEFNLDNFKNILMQIDKPFITSLYEASINEANNKTSKRRNQTVFGAYMKNIAMKDWRELTWKNGDGNKKNNTNDNINIVGNENIYENDENEFDLKNIEKKIKWTEEDSKTLNDVVRILGYEPFAGYSKFDCKFLYAELLPYLDEETQDDQYKVSMIIQILNNNNQIRKIDLALNQLTCDSEKMLKNSSDIKALISAKQAIVGNNDKISKENSIAIKHRGDKTAGKSTLTYMMKNLRELNFENAEQDYYDQNKAFGMKRVADISNKSIMEQLQFDENDYVDMIKTQRELIEELQNKNEDIEEKNRQLHVEIQKLKKLIS